MPLGSCNSYKETLINKAEKAGWEQAGKEPEGLSSKMKTEIHFVVVTVESMCQSENNIWAKVILMKAYVIDYEKQIIQVLKYELIWCVKNRRKEINLKHILQEEHLKEMLKEKQL